MKNVKMFVKKFMSDITLGIFGLLLIAANQSNAQIQNLNNEGQSYLERTNEKIFVDPLSIADSEQSNIEAVNSISNKTEVKFDKGSTGFWKAGKCCTLQPGFIATEGCTFRACVGELNSNENSSSKIFNAKSSIQKTSEVEKLLIQPNPATTILNVVSDSQNGHIQLYSMIGKPVAEKDLADGKTQIDVSSLAKGTYLLNLKSEDGQTTTKKVAIK